MQAARSTHRWGLRLLQWTLLRRPPLIRRPQVLRPRRCTLTLSKSSIFGVSPSFFFWPLSASRTQRFASLPPIFAKGGASANYYHLVPCKIISLTYFCYSSARSNPTSATPPSLSPSEPRLSEGSRQLLVDLFHFFFLFNITSYDRMDCFAFQPLRLAVTLPISAFMTGRLFGRCQ